MEVFRKLKKIEPNKQTFIALMIIVALLFGALFLLWGNLLVYTSEQQFVFLANSFLHGKLYFLEEPSVISGWWDASYYEGKYYWPLGIFPSLLILPYVFVYGTSFMQGYISPFLSFASVFILYKIAYKYTKSKYKSLILSTSYIFATAYVMVAFSPVSWYFSHVVATFCLLLSIYYVLVENRPLLAGVFFAFAFLTRITIVLGVLFYVLNYFFDHKDYLKRTLRFLLPVVFGIAVFFTYNYFRFGNMLETGYSHQLLFGELHNTRTQGMWSLRHIPMHLFLMFFKGPTLIMEPGSFMLSKVMPSPLGMSIVFTSPILLFILLADLKKKINITALAGAIPVALFLIGTFGLGVFQYGYRFAFDYQPFLFVVLCQVFAKKKMTMLFLLFLVLSVLFNLVMWSQFYGAFSRLFFGDFSNL